MKHLLIAGTVLLFGCQAAGPRLGEEIPAGDFESCVRDKGQIMESYPRQCRDQEGNVYVEILTETPQAENGPWVPEEGKFQEGDQGVRLCEDRCGNGTCEEIVCLGEGCPCAETAISCFQDCQVKEGNLD